MQRIEPGTMLQERYRIEATLSQSRLLSLRRSLQMVYKAYDVKLDKVVAIQGIGTLLSVSVSKSIFEAEILPLTLLNHQNLPCVHDFFQVDNSCFWVVEFVEGENLAQLLAERGREFSIDVILCWASLLLDTLEYLHGRGILHANVRPNSLFPIGLERLRLVSFGLPNVLSVILRSWALQRVESLDDYESIEHFNHGNNHGEMTARSDIYSVGATLYHLLTNQAPLSSFERHYKISGKDLDVYPAHQVNSLIPLPISRALEWAMQIKPDDRPQTIAELRAALFAS